MSYIGQAALKTTNIKRFDVTGSTSATHVLSWTAPSEQTLWITINGVKQQDDAYTIAGSPTTITLSSALVSADKMEVIGVVDMGVSTYPVDGSVSTASLGNTSVTTAKIAADAVTATEIATGAVGTTEIAANAVDTSEIAADAVGLTEMAGLARGKLIVGDSSGNPSALTVGTSGQYLTSDGNDASWGAVTSLPSQTGNTGKTLITDGTDASWQTITPNIFINGDFDIWQRDTSFNWTNATNFYVCDRWHFEANGMTGTFARQTFTNAQTDVPDGPAYYARWICNTTMPVGQSAWFSQRIEAGPNGLGNKLSGQEVTLSMWLKSVSGTIPSGNLLFVGNGLSSPENELGAIGPTWAKYTATWTLPTLGAYATVGLYLPATYALLGGIDIAHAQLELGPVATTFKSRSFGQELYDCKRYFRHVNKQFYCYAISSSIMDCFPHWEQEMRANPSCTLNTTTPAFYEINVATRTGSSSTISTGTFNKREAFVRIGGFGGTLSTNTFRYLLSTENMFSFSAEL